MSPMREWQQVPAQIIRASLSKCPSLSDPSRLIRPQKSRDRHRSRLLFLVFDRPTDWVTEAATQIKPFAVQLLGHEPPTQVAELKKSLSCEIWKSLFLPTENDPAADAKAIFAQIESYIDAGADSLLFDTAEFTDGKARFGGTGKQSDWSLSAQLIQACKVPAFLSGGIRPENVRRAIETVRPYGVDLCSGVEASKGIRDQQKLERLMEHARAVSR